ncbi:MAG: TraB/GumN family protein [Gammaproteobacteria bacterium]
MMKSHPDIPALRLGSLLLSLLFGVINIAGLQADTLECRSYQEIDSVYDGPEKFGRGLLWEVSREGLEPSYLFGTMHVDDEDILDLPDVVLSRLAESRHFVMETVPSFDDAMKFSMEMFFTNGNRLDGLVPEEIFDRTVDILQGYNMTRDIVTIMKPWAAYVIMSYPANTGEVLDFRLLELARRNGAEISGLESLEEQIDIFSDMSLDDQARILADVVCHYDRVEKDLKIMKSFYLDRDLAGLYVYSQRYSFEDNSVYDDVSGRLIYDRNRLMTERMVDIIDEGGAFIAVGAMHLPGDDGILNLLENKNYTIKHIY